MEYTREVKVTIYKDTNKSTQDEVLTLGEFNEDETIHDFMERVNKRMEEIFLNQF